ncbi:MAG: hypothetical protein ACRDHD_09510 [Candidatus Limnocylindria bacterium]
MDGSPRPVVLVLLTGGLLLLLAAIAGLAAGLFLAEWIHRRLPEITADAAAVGGAAFALGSVTLAAAGLHLVLALATVRRRRWALLPVFIVCAAMATLGLGWAVAALVSAASGAGQPAVMLPAGAGLLVLAAAYGWAAAVAIGRWRRARRPT